MAVQKSGPAPRCLTYNELVETGCCEHVGKIVGSEERKRQKETGEKEKNNVLDFEI